jgi:hypothetical protein
MSDGAGGEMRVELTLVGQARISGDVSIQGTVVLFEGTSEARPIATATSPSRCSCRGRVHLADDHGDERGRGRRQGRGRDDLQQLRRVTRRVV